MVSYSLLWTGDFMTNTIAQGTQRPQHRRTPIQSSLWRLGLLRLRHHELRVLRRAVLRRALPGRWAISRRRDLLRALPRGSLRHCPICHLEGLLVVHGSRTSSIVHQDQGY